MEMRLLISFIKYRQEVESYDLIDVKHYLRDRKVVPLNDLALHFRTDIRSMKPLLDVWIDNGTIKPCRKISGTYCRGCGKCNTDDAIAYEWMGG